MKNSTSKSILRLFLYLAGLVALLIVLFFLKGGSLWIAGLPKTLTVSVENQGSNTIKELEIGMCNSSVKVLDVEKNAMVKVVLDYKVARECWYQFKVNAVFDDGQSLEQKIPHRPDELNQVLITNEKIENAILSK